MSGQALQTLKALEQIKDSRGEFIENLKGRGLDEEEIRYCCLEVLGVRNSTKTRI